jgi:hypothetical protein
MKKIIIIMMILSMLPIVYGVDSCVTDRSCCADVTNSVDELCWRNDTITWTDMVYDVHKDYSEGIAEDFQLHYHGGDYSCNNPEEFANNKGACEQFRSYNQPFGYLWKIEGGIVSDKRWTPYKLMQTNRIYSPFSAEIELEKVMDRRYIVNHFVIKCKDNDDCDVGVDPIRLTNTNLPTDSVYVTDIDGSYCGYRINESTSSNSYESATDWEVLHVIYPCPDSITDATTAYANYNAVLNEELEIYSIAVATSVDGVDLGTEAGISDWILNFTNKSEEIADEYQEYMDAYLPPTGYVNDTTIRRYWDGFYSVWFDSFKQADETDTTSPFYAYGEAKEIMTPNLLSYYGQWVWDSFTESLHIMAHLNYSKPQGFAINKIIWAGELWANKSSHYPTESTWYQSIRPKALTPPSQPAEGWMLTALYAYNKSIYTEDFLCNQLYPALQSHYEATIDSRGNDWTFNNINGRDASDAVYLPTGSGTYNTDAGGFFAMASISMFTIAKECEFSNSTQERYLSAYNNVTQYFNSNFWNKDIGNYWNLNGTYSPYLHALDPTSTSMATTPMGSCFAIGVGITNQSQVENIITSLRTDFVDTYGLTSINTAHACYTPDADDISGCFAGDTWDGASWLGIDNFWCINALMEARDYWNITGIDDDISWLINLTANTIENSDTNFGAESYGSDDASTSDASLWGSKPYAWGMPLPITSTGFSEIYNMFSVLDFSGILINGTDTSPTPSSNISFYNVTHPRMHRHTQANMLSFTNSTGSPYKDRYDAIVATISTDDDASTNGGTARYWKVGQIAYHNALCYYLTDDADCLADAIEFLSSTLNDTPATWNALSVHNRGEMLGALGYTFDIVEPTLTDNQTEDFVNLAYNISVAVFDNDFDDYELNISNDNGHFIRGSVCSFMLAFKGHHYNDANYTSSNRWQKCIDMAETGIQGYLGGTSEPDGGFDYVEYGGEFFIPFLEAYDYAENSTLLEVYNDTICGGIGKDFAYYLTDINEVGTSGDSLRHIDYGDGNEYNGIYPFITNFYARQCNDPISNWLSLYQYNYTDNYDSYSLIFALDLAIYNNTVGVQSPSEANLNTEWYDTKWGRTIWRDGWTFTTDLIFGYGGWGVQSAGHGQQDDMSFILHYNGYPLLADAGDRNGTNEIPSGTKYHNTLTVDNKGTMNWNNDRADTTPASLHYVGIDYFPLAGSCSYDTTCSYLSDDYNMHIETHTTGTTYNEIMSVKQYYTIQNWTRRVIYLKDLSEPLYIIKDDVTDDNNHNYSFNFNTQTIGVSQSGTNLTATRNSTNVQILINYNSTQCNWDVDKERYGKKSTDEIVTLNSINCSEMKNATIITSIIPYTTSTSLSLQYTANTTHHAINITNSSINKYVVFSKSNVEEDIKYLTTFNDSDIGCTESWSCTAWSDIDNSCGTRTCTDANACGTTVSKPSETETCPEAGGGGGGGGSSDSSITITTNKEKYKYLETIIINITYDGEFDLVVINVLKDEAEIDTITLKTNQTTYKYTTLDSSNEIKLKAIARQGELTYSDEINITIEPLNQIYTYAFIFLIIGLIITGLVYGMTKWINR